MRCGIAASGGYGLGILLGGFFHSMQPMDMQVDKLTTSEQIRLGYRGIGQASVRMAKNFSKVGMLYASSECIIEKERGVHDIANAVYAGCAAGGMLSMHGGPGAALFGCAGFAAFSGAIELFMHS